MNYFKMKFLNYIQQVYPLPHLFMYILYLLFSETIELCLLCTVHTYVQWVCLSVALRQQYRRVCPCRLLRKLCEYAFQWEQLACFPMVWLPFPTVYVQCVCCCWPGVQTVDRLLILQQLLFVSFYCDVQPCQVHSVFSQASQPSTFQKYAVAISVYKHVCFMYMYFL